MFTKKLDIKVIHSVEICPNDRNIIETIFELENPNRFVINPSLILLIDLGLIFHNRECPDYELTLISVLPSEIASTVDLATTI